MLSVINLEKTYQTRTGVRQKAIDKITVNFGNQGLVFVVGKSGSGKSTLLNLIGGLDSPDNGFIEIDGKPSDEFKQSDFDSYRNTYLGFVFQDFNILPNFTVRENINLAYELQGKTPNEETLQDILRQIDLVELASRYPNELSGGQIQRVSIARALIKNPHIIMADEPTGNLDSETGKQVFELLKKLSNDKLVIVVSHDTESANEFANRIIKLKDGKIISDVSKTNDFKNNFEPTNIEPQNANESLTLIKSKLPLSVAYRMGKSSLKQRKGRLFLTLLLSIIAVALFGLSDAIGRFSVVKASQNTYANSNYSLLPFAKEVNIEGTDQTKFISPTSEQITLVEDGLNQSVYTGYHYNIEFIDMIHDDIPYYNNYYIQFLSGIIELPDETSLENSYIGTFPTDETKILINNYMLEHFIDYGFEYYDTSTGTIKYLDDVQSFSDIQNKTVRIRIGVNYQTFEITGMVIYDLSKYEVLKDKWAEITEHSTYDEKKDIDFSIDQYTILSRLIVKTGFNQANFVDMISSQSVSIANQGNDQDINIELLDITPPTDLNKDEQYDYLNKDRIDFSEFKTINTDDYYFGSIVTPTSLANNEIIVPSNWFNMSDTSELDQYLGQSLKFKLVTNDTVTEEYDRTDYETELTIVGFYVGNMYYMNYNVVVPNKVFDDIIDLTINNSDYMYTYLDSNHNNTDLFQLLDDHSFKHQTSLSQGIYRVSDLFSIVKQIFFYLALILLVFNLLLIMNVISSSITYKQTEIGILRALGARKTDVFKIFYTEGFIISTINTVFSLILLIAGIILFNNFIRNAMGAKVLLLALGLRQILLLLLICFGSVVIASFLPINKFANKTPIEAIRKHK